MDHKWRAVGQSFFPDVYFGWKADVAAPTDLRLTGADAYNKLVVRKVLIPSVHPGVF